MLKSRVEKSLEKILRNVYSLYHNSYHVANVLAYLSCWRKSFERFLLSSWGSSHLEITNIKCRYQKFLMAIVFGKVKYKSQIPIANNTEGTFGSVLSLQ